MAIYLEKIRINSYRVISDLSIDGPITDEQIIEWIKQGLTVAQVESTYNIKLSQPEKIKFIQLKVKSLSK